jgi:autotransporter-associated beta strand protein
LGSADGTDAQGTTVASGATLQLQGGIGITTEKLNLNGSGYDGAGALENVSGNNTWGAASTARINLQSDSRINSDAGTLGIVTNITSSANNAVTFGGAGNTNVSGGIITGTGSSTTVTKDGTGTLTLSGANSYQGATYITQGVASVQNNFGLGAATTGANGTFVSSGAQLQLDSTAHGNLNIAAEGLTLNGSGVGNTGALLNAVGTNTYGGPVSLGSNATIAANASTALTVSGGISSTNFGLTVGTSGNTGSVTVNGALNLGTGSVTKTGSGAFTYTGASAGVTTGSVGAVALNGGSMTVGDGAHVTTLNSSGLTTASGTSLLIATGGTMSVTGSVTLSGNIDSNSAGTLQINGGSTLTFNSSINAANLTLVVNGGSIGTNAAPATLYLGNLGSTGSVTVGNIHITGDTILDFGNSAGTFLSSTNLVVDPSAKVTVLNWISVANSAVQSTIWYLRNLSQTPAPSMNSTTTLGNTDIVGGSPLDQISFSDPIGSAGSSSTWVSGDHDGWFDHEIRPTPEPSTYGVVSISACLGLFGWRRYRRRLTA